MPRISGFADFARSVANRLVDREGSVTTRVGAGELRTFLAITPDDERRIRSTIVGAIEEGYDFCERTFDLAKNDAMDHATRVTFQVVAEEMGLSQDGTAKEIQDRIFAEFHRLKEKDIMGGPDSYLWKGKMVALKTIKEALEVDVVADPDLTASILAGKIEDLRKELSSLKEKQDTVSDFEAGYAKAVKDIAWNLGIASEGTAEDVFWAVIDHFCRKDNDHEEKLKEARKAGAMEESKRIEEIIQRHKKSHEDRASECDKKARILKSDLEDVERMAEEHRRDAEAHRAVWDLVFIINAVDDGLSFPLSTKDED